MLLNQNPGSILWGHRAAGRGPGGFTQGAACLIHKAGDPGTLHTLALMESTLGDTGFLPLVRGPHLALSTTLFTACDLTQTLQRGDGFTAGPGHTRLCKHQVTSAQAPIPPRGWCAQSPLTCMMRMHIPTVPSTCLLSSNHSLTFS